MRMLGVWIRGGFSRRDCEAVVLILAGKKITILAVKVSWMGSSLLADRRISLVQSSGC